MRPSGKLREIVPTAPITWSDRSFITIDIDWAHDDVLRDAIELLDETELNVTWFVTHDTPILARLRENPQYDLGIHPNFNWLLAGDTRGGANAVEVVDRMMKIVPDAKCVRSHSMAQSTGLLQIFSDAGLTHDANHFVPASSDVELKPWVLWNGMTRVPYCWEDDIFCIYRERGIAEPDVAGTMAKKGLRVFDFHPIHLFLNTESMTRYERTRALHQDPIELVKHRYIGNGARSWLLELTEGIRSKISADNLARK